MPTPPLFLVDVLPDGDDVLLDGDEGRHAARVKRLQRDEPVTVTDGRGTQLSCTVAEVLADGLRLHVLARRTIPAPQPRLVVAQALIKGDRSELAVEVLTELGVDEIVPWQAQRSIVQWHGPRGERALDKWRRTAREAAKQSRRPWVPVIGDPLDTGTLARRAHGAVVLHESATDRLADVALPSDGDVLVVVGPEGGIGPDELALFTDAGARTVRLGEPVMRASTAGAAALAALSLRLGRWG